MTKEDFNKEMNECPEHSWYWYGGSMCKFYLNIKSTSFLKTVLFL
jgi:hypothetical protein